MPVPPQAPATRRATPPRAATVVAFVVVSLIPLIASAMPGNGCLDPLTTYTNGMPLASSTPLRSHNVYYRCDEGRVGCCGGRYNRPCVNSLFAPNTCCTPRTPNAYAAWPVGAPESVATVDPAQFEQLGAIPNDTLALPGASPGGGQPSGIRALLPQ